MENKTVDELFDMAIATLPELRRDEIFTVKELFRAFEWNRIPVGNRTRLGIKFFAYINEHGNEEALKAKSLDKTKQNQQRYIKL